jgi:cytochrome c553
MRALVLVMAASVALVACVAETPGDLIEGTGAAGAGTSGTAGGSSTSNGTTGTGGSSAGRDFFEANVKPFMVSDCGFCHADAADPTGAPDFFGLSDAEYYDTLVADPNMVSASPESSRLINRGVHTGPALEPGDYDTTLAWLQMEAEARFGGGGGFEGPTADELLQKFSDCMTITDWTDSGMHTIALQPTLTAGACHMCHQSGTAANYMTNPNAGQASIQDGFDKERVMPFLMNLVTTRTVTGPNGKQHYEVVQSMRWNDKAATAGTHPKFLFTQQQPKIDAWFTLVVESTCFKTP